MYISRRCKERRQKVYNVGITFIFPFYKSTFAREYYLLEDQTTRTGWTETASIALIGLILDISKDRRTTSIKGTTPAALFRSHAFSRPVGPWPSRPLRLQRPFIYPSATQVYLSRLCSKHHVLFIRSSVYYPLWPRYNYQSSIVKSKYRHNNNSHSNVNAETFNSCSLFASHADDLFNRLLLLTNIQTDGHN